MLRTSLASQLIAQRAGTCILHRIRGTFDERTSQPRWLEVRTSDTVFDIRDSNMGIAKKSGGYNEVFKSGKNYVFYCKSGGRSALAASRASEMGVKNILNLTGGFINWKKTNGPVEN